MTPRRAKPSPKKRPTEGPNAPWRIHFFQRHRDDDSARTVPAREFLDRCPTGVAADIIATVKAVAEAPPPRFAGGGQWQVMHGSMKGFHEVRVTGPGRRRYRLFCILERNAPGLGGEPMLGALLVFPRYKFVALMGSGRPQSLRPLVMLLAARAKVAAVPGAQVSSWVLGGKRPERAPKRTRSPQVKLSTGTVRAVSKTSNPRTKQIDGGLSNSD